MLDICYRYGVVLNHFVIGYYAEADLARAIRQAKERGGYVCDFWGRSRVA